MFILILLTGYLYTVYIYELYILKLYDQSILLMKIIGRYDEANKYCISDFGTRH